MICSPEIINRIKRTKGQMQGVIKMMEEQSSCQDIVVQLKAIKASVDKVIAIMTTDNLLQTLDQHNTENEDVKKAVSLIIKGIA
ncbi:MAG: metal-sensing transcriptional repressor [Acholeplasmataceae bacterium]